MRTGYEGKCRRKAHPKNTAVIPSEVLLALDDTGHSSALLMDLINELPLDIDHKKYGHWDGLAAVVGALADAEEACLAEPSLRELLAKLDRPTRRLRSSVYVPPCSRRIALSEQQVNRLNYPLLVALLCGVFGEDPGEVSRGGFYCSVLPAVPTHNSESLPKMHSRAVNLCKFWTAVCIIIRTLTSFGIWLSGSGPKHDRAFEKSSTCPYLRSY